MAGRGTGKTRTGAETVAHWAHEYPGARIGLVGPTYADIRETMVEGESGLLAVIPRQYVKSWVKTDLTLTLTNGSILRGFPATEPERLRGPQHWFCWGDEVGSWTKEETLDLLLLGLRLGPRPRVVFTTTPRSRPLVRKIIGRPTTRLSTGSTYDNLINLAPTFAEEVLATYAGSRYERQEIFGELIDDVEGALWTLLELDTLRVDEAPELLRCVIGVDPAGGGRDKTGIVAAGRGVNGDGYVLADRSGQLHPEEWAKRAIAAYREFKADRIVAEKNYGGEMVEHTIRSVDPHVPVRLVSATRGKVIRAEPIATLYRQGHVHHVGPHRELEDQMTQWTQDAGTSPDRMDALVWALTDVMENSSTAAWLRSIPSATQRSEPRLGAFGYR
jgi:phage terminase large subunit-like protein